MSFEVDAKLEKLNLEVDALQEKFDETDDPQVLAQLEAKLAELDAVLDAHADAQFDAHIEELRKKSLEARCRGQWVNAETLERCIKNARNLEDFVFHDRGYAVPKVNTDLLEHLNAIW